ncbi:MAG: hypothetical protein LRY72_00085 [Saccharospirillaceae bacterium]|nr:hypothetical protein [Saccharospirillaceae bacterium]
MPVAALLTRHGKGPLLAAALRPQEIGVISIAHWDTDQLGTFSGEIERPMPAPQVVRLKAILAADLSGCGLGLGSEGSFGGGPYPGLLPWQQELVALFNHDTGQCVTGVAAGPAPLGVQQLADEPALALLLSRYPGQGWIVRHAGLTCKGLTTAAQILERVSAWPLTLEPDWRAMHSPLRAQRIRAAADNLAQRLAAHCPACQRPRFLARRR